MKKIIDDKELKNFAKWAENTNITEGSYFENYNKIKQSSLNKYYNEESK